MGKFLKLLSLVVVLVSSFAWADPAHPASPWSDPVQLSEQDATTPTLIADSSGGVHVFWGSTGLNGTQGAIFYRRLVDGIWSPTVDIIAPPSGTSAIHPSVAIDAQGTLHLVWVGEKLYYSRVHLSQALDPRAWETPYQMTNYDSTNAELQIGMDGSLYVLFGSRGINPAVYLLKSEDGGDFWQVAVQVSMPQRGGYALSCSLAIDPLGRLHAAWAEASAEAVPTEGLSTTTPEGIFYSRSDDGGAHWTYPHRVAGREQGDPAIGVDAQAGIHIFWSGMGLAAGKYHAILDPKSGEWSRTERILPTGEGMLGLPSMALDSAGRLQIAIPVASQTTSSQTASSEIVTLSWSTGGWGSYFEVTQNLMDALVEHSSPCLVVAGGDRLHLVWVATQVSTDTAEEILSTVWYASQQLTAPRLEAVAVATLSLIPATTTPDVQPTQVLPTPTPWTVVASGFLPQQPMWYKQVPVIFGASLALFGLIVVVRISLRKRTDAD